MFAKKTVTIAHLNTVYYQTTQAPTVLILHGWGGRATSWLPIAEALEKEGYGVLVPDLPGFGESEEPNIPWSVADYVEWLFMFLKEVHCEKPHVIAHSFGGRMVFRSHKDHEEWASSYVLCGAAGIFHTPTLKQKLIKTLSRPLRCLGVQSLLKYTLVKKVFGKIFGTRDYIDASPLMKETMKLVIAEDQSSYVGKIQVPTAILWGEKDTYTPVEDAYFLHTHIAGSTLKVFPSGKHGLHVSHRENLTWEILSFLRSI